jgi:hypothetical protein
MPFVLFPNALDWQSILGRFGTFLNIHHFAGLF